MAAQQILGSALPKGRIDVREESAWMVALGLATSQELASVGQWLIVLTAALEVVAPGW